MEFIDIVEAVLKDTDPNFKGLAVQNEGNLHDEDRKSLMKVKITDIGLDSLDIALMTTTLGEIYNVPNEILDNAQNIETFEDLEKLLGDEGKRIPESVEEAMRYLV